MRNTQRPAFVNRIHNHREERRCRAQIVKDRHQAEAARIARDIDRGMSVNMVDPLGTLRNESVVTYYRGRAAGADHAKAFEFALSIQKSWDIKPLAMPSPRGRESKGLSGEDVAGIIGVLLCVAVVLIQMVA